MIRSVLCATFIPGLLSLFWLTGLISFLTGGILLALFLLIFVIFPLIFRYSITLQRGILFLTFITYPKGLDLTKPESVGLYGTRNLYVTVRDDDADVENENGVKIGVWHVLPKHVVKRFAVELNLNEEHHSDINNATNAGQAKDEHLERMIPVLKSEFPSVLPENEGLFYERMLKLPGTVVLYLHGNTASRGSGHRVDIYKMLRTLGYHVLTMDYRSYGDSDAVAPTEEGVVRDAMAVYEYISKLTSNPIIIWGHSLGTGVSTHLCSQLSSWKERGPRGVILESPFTSIRDEIREHPFAKLFKQLPWFNFTIAHPMYRNSLRFDSIQHISEFRQPVMIIHAEDDYVVPFHLGYQLYRAAIDTRGKSWGPVEFHRFAASHKYGHKYLCRAPELPDLVRNFVENYRNEVF